MSSSAESIDVVRRREALLRDAASLDPRVFQRNALLKQGKYSDACAQNWSAGDVEAADDEVPVLDAIMQSAIPKDDLVVLSDGNCYSKSSMIDFVDRGVVTFATGRAKLPLTNKEMTDLDYALIGRDWGASAEAGSQRTLNVIVDAHQTRRTDDDVWRERDMRNERNFQAWRRGEQPLTLYMLNRIGADANFRPSVWATAIEQFWSDPKAYEKEMSGPELWSEVTGLWPERRRLDQFPFYVSQVLKHAQTTPNRQKLLDIVSFDYTFELFDRLGEPEVDWPLLQQWIRAWPSVSLMRAHPGFYENIVHLIVQQPDPRERSIGLDSGLVINRALQDNFSNNYAKQCANAHQASSNGNTLLRDSMKQYEVLWRALKIKNPKISFTLARFAQQLDRRLARYLAAFVLAAAVAEMIVIVQSMPLP